LDYKSLSLPLKVDWRDAGVVTEVKNQKTCGACYAISVIEAIETMSAIKTGELKERSVQQILDCNPSGMKCQGGSECSILDWLYREKVRVQTESDYPEADNHNDDRECRANAQHKPAINVRDYFCQRYGPSYATPATFH